MAAPTDQTVLDIARESGGHLHYVGVYRMKSGFG